MTATGNALFFFFIVVVSVFAILLIAFGAASLFDFHCDCECTDCETVLDGMGFWRFAGSPFGQALIGASLGGGAAFAGTIYFSQSDEVRKNTLDLIKHFNSPEMVMLRRGAQNFLEDFCGLDDPRKKFSETYLRNLSLDDIFGYREEFIAKLNVNILADGKPEKLIPVLPEDKKADPERLQKFYDGADRLRGAFALVELVGDVTAMNALDKQMLLNAIGGFLGSWIEVFEESVKHSEGMKRWETSCLGFSRARAFLKPN